MLETVAAQILRRQLKGRAGAGAVFVKQRDHRFALQQGQALILALHHGQHGLGNVQNACDLLLGKALQAQEVLVLKLHLALL